MSNKKLISLFKETIHNEYTRSSKYINRELSWLEFNKRVLFQSLRPEVPLIERFNFLNITSSNLDEFIMVRFASVINRMRHEDKKELSGMHPDKEYSVLLESIKRFKNMQFQCYDILTERLKKTGIEILKYKDLNKSQSRYVSDIFFKRIYPILTPMNFDTTKEYPEFTSRQLTIAVLLEDDNLQVISFIPLDSSLDKLYKISKNKEIYITLEEILYGHLNRIYYKKKILDYGMIKILRESDIELDHNTDIYITERMRNTLMMRKYSTPIFMECTNNISKSFLKLLSKTFDLNKSHTFKSPSVIDFSPYMSIKSDKEKYQPFSPQFPSELLGDPDMFTAISDNDILLHHPYESYDPIVRFVEQASTDPFVISIKQTLYRVSSEDSPIINALCTAARNGKQVSVILEIKARFDEERNISLIEKLKGCGCQLSYGIEELKTHCKFIVIVRKEKDKLKIYSHIATGNYNDKTSKIYTDISYFTNSLKIGRDLITVFNMISGFSEPNADIDKLYFSPYNLRKEIIRNIDNEIGYAKKNKMAMISLKMNSLCDKEIIDKLYEAAHAGVKIVILCRGICSMYPHKNIVIRSLVGRFLEHSRIYYFYNNNKPNIYISSADLLTRNLDKRFELLIPIKDDNTKNKLLKILGMYYRDTFNTFEMDLTGQYTKLESNKGINIHGIFMNEAIENYKLKSLPKLYKKR